MYNFVGNKKKIMEIVMTIDTKSPEAKAFYQYSKTLSFVKTQRKGELSDEEVEKLTQEMGDISNANMTNKFLLNRLKRKSIQK